MGAPTARLLVSLGCVAATCSAASCGSGGGGSSEQPTRRINLVVGDIVPTTGTLAGLGVSAQKAAQLAVEEANDAIGEADVDHALEIVHEDATARGAKPAAKRLLADGVACIVGPWSRRGLAEVAREPQVRMGALLISPRARVRGIAGGSADGVVGLPPLGDEIALSSESDDRDRDPRASFAKLYASTDPPIGPARTSDARQFDAVLLCYLAAVAAGSPAGPRMADYLGRPASEARPFTWLHLADAIAALEQGQPIVYAGLTARVGILTAAPGG